MRHGLLHVTRNHKKSCTFPSIKKNLPIRQILLQDHFAGEKPFVYSLEGKKITCEMKRRTPDMFLNPCNKTLSMHFCSILLKFGFGIFLEVILILFVVLGNILFHVKIILIIKLK